MGAAIGSTPELPSAISGSDTITVQIKAYEGDPYQQGETLGQVKVEGYGWCDIGVSYVGGSVTANVYPLDIAIEIKRSTLSTAYIRATGASSYTIEAINFYW